MLFLKHINTSAIMDILLRFLTTIDDHQMKKRVLEWLNKIKIIEKIIELLSHTYTSEVHSNASQILCDIVRISREQIVKVAANENDLFFTSESSVSTEDRQEDVKDDISPNTSIKSTVYEANPLLSAIEEYVFAYLTLKLKFIRD